MSDISEKVRLSKEAGYSDKDILDFLGQLPDYSEKVKASRASGKPDTEIVGFLEKMPDPPKTDPMRAFGSLARGTAEGAMDVATLPYRLADKGGGVDKFKETMLSSAPKPETKIEKMAEGAGEGIGATLPGIGVGALLERAGLPLLSKLGSFLKSGPKTQLATGATSGAADVEKPGAGLAVSALSPVGIEAGRKIANPGLGHLTGDQPRLLKLAEQAGIPLSAADRTGNKVLKQAEGVMRTLPGSSGVMQGRDVAKREAFNNAILKVAGINEKYASPEILDKAHNTLGKELDALAKLSDSTLDKQWATEVDRINFDMGRRLPTDQAPVFKSYMDDLEPYLIAARSGQPQPLTGERYDEIRKGIAKRFRTTNDPALKEALGGLMSSLDGAMERTAKPQLKPLWDDARRRYATLMVVEKAMSGGTQEDRNIGNIPFSGLKSAVLAQDKGGFSRGRGQLNDLTRVGEFIAPKLPTSGTSERSNMTRILQGAGPASALTYGLTTGDVITPSVALASPYLASKAYGTDAVTNWLSRPSSVAQKGLLRTLAESGKLTLPQAAREASE